MVALWQGESVWLYCSRVGLSHCIVVEWMWVIDSDVRVCVKKSDPLMKGVGWLVGDVGLRWLWMVDTNVGNM